MTQGFQIITTALLWVYDVVRRRRGVSVKKKNEPMPK